MWIFFLLHLDDAIENLFSITIAFSQIPVGKISWNHDNAKKNLIFSQLIPLGLKKKIRH